jgi:hypothetical protein
MKRKKQKGKKEDTKRMGNKYVTIRSVPVLPMTFFRDFHGVI